MASTTGSSSAPENPSPMGFAVLPIFVLDDAELGDHEIRVLLALSSFTGADSKCWPSLRALASRCGGSSKRQLQRILNGYTRGAERVPGLVEIGYVTTQLRESRSNVFRLNFDRWTGRKGGDTGVTASYPDRGDTGVREGATPAPPLYKEQEQENNTLPQPPRQARGRVTRDVRKRIEAIEAEQLWICSESVAYQDATGWKPGISSRHPSESFEANTHCSSCGGALDPRAPAIEVTSPNGLKSYAPAFAWQVVEDVLIRRGLPEPSVEDQELARATFASVLPQLVEICGHRPAKYWIRPLTPHSVQDGELRLVAPDTAHADYCRELFEEHGNALDAAAIRLVVSDPRSSETQLTRKAWHRECAPEEVRDG